MPLKFSKVCIEHNDCLPCWKNNSDPCVISSKKDEIILVMALMELRKRLNRGQNGK